MDTAGADRDNAAVNRTRLWLLPLLLAGLVLGGWYFGYRAKGEDRELPVYTTGAERMLRGEQIYRRGTDAKPFTYPPFAAVPFVPFVAVPADWRPPVWFAANFAILLLLARWLHRYGARTVAGWRPPRLAWFWCLTVLLGGRHVISVLTNQSHDLLIAGLVGLTAAAWCKDRSSAGLWAGLGAASKATPALFVCLFALRGRAAAVLWLAVAAAAATLLPDWLWPWQGGAWWRAWYDVNLAGLQVGGTASAEGAWNAHSVLNQSLSGTLVRLFTPVAVADPKFVVGERGSVLVCELSAWLCRGVSITAQLAVLALIAVAVRAGHRCVRSAVDAGQAQWAVGLGEVSAIACGMLLLSPQSSKAHFCTWLFPAAFLADRLLRAERDWIAWLLMLGALACALVAKELFGRELGNLFLAYGNVTWATLLLLLATVRCLRVLARR